MAGEPAQGAQEPGVSYRVVTVRTEVIAVETGFWCNRCALSSAVRAFIALTCQGRASLLTRYQCADCGSHDVQVPA